MVLMDILRTLKPLKTLRQWIRKKKEFFCGPSTKLDKKKLSNMPETTLRCNFFNYIDRATF